MEQKRFVLNGNLKTKGRKRYLFRDDEGRVEGYGTQLSMPYQDKDGTWVAIPTIVDGNRLPEEGAVAHYRKTGEFFHRGRTRDEAIAGGRAAHNESEEENLAWWNNYIADHIDDGTLAPELQKMKDDPGFMRWARGEEEGAYKRELRQDAKGGDAPGESAEVPPSEGGPVPEGGPRIVINPSTFRNEKDALCVAFNEAFRIVMEDMQFDPVSEPTERQRRFFSDTAYANDETQLRRTILARICTFDTSVKDPTDEQLEEAVEFLEDVMEAGIPQNEWEQSSVQRMHDVIVQSVGRRPAEEAPAEEAPAEEAPAEEAPAEEAQADEQGGETEEDDDGTAQGDDEAALADNEIKILGLDMAASNDVFQFDPYSKREEDGEQAARDEAAGIIGPMALKRDDATEKRRRGTPGAWNGSSKQIGPQTSGTYNSRSPNFKGGTGSPGSWDGRLVQTGDAYRRR